MLKYLFAYISHLMGYCHKDVLLEVQMKKMKSSEFPLMSINLDLANMGITTVSENSLTGCTNLRLFRIEFPRCWKIYLLIILTLLTLTLIAISSQHCLKIFQSRSQANLDVLIMDGCRITNENFNTAWFQSLVNIRTLYTGNNLFTSAPPTLFGNLPSILAFEFSNQVRMGVIQEDAFR